MRNGYKKHRADMLPEAETTNRLPAQSSEEEKKRESLEDGAPGFFPASRQKSRSLPHGVGRIAGWKTIRPRMAHTALQTGPNHGFVPTFKERRDQIPLISRNLNHNAAPIGSKI